MAKAQPNSIAASQNATSELDLKYSPGGLVEIEFCSNWPSLIRAFDHVFTSERDLLLQNYRFLRLVEQGLRGLFDEKTNILALSHQDFNKISVFMNYKEQNIVENLSRLLHDNQLLLERLDPRLIQR